MLLVTLKQTVLVIRMRKTAKPMRKMVFCIYTTHADLDLWYILLTWSHCAL